MPNTVRLFLTVIPLCALPGDGVGWQTTLPRCPNPSVTVSRKASSKGEAVRIRGDAGLANRRATTRSASLLTLDANIQTTATLRLAATPTVVLGASPATAADELLDVIAATRLANGTIAIADRGAYEVRVYDRRGRIIGRTGRRGQGPGDFDGFARMWKGAGDSLQLWDHAQGRVSVLDPTAKYVRSWPRLEGVTGWYFILGRFGDGSLLAELPISSTPPTHSGIVIREMILARIAPENSSIDTLGRFVRGESVVLLNSEGQVSGSARIPLARFGHVAAAADVFYYGDGASSGIQVYDKYGKAVRTLPVEAPRRQMSAAERESAMHEVTSNPRMPPTFSVALERAFDEIQRRPMVAFDSVLADGAGRMWIRDAAGFNTASRTWTIYNQDGSQRGRISIPSTLGILEVGSDYVLTSDDSAAGLTIVKEYAILSR